MKYSDSQQHGVATGKRRCSNAADETKHINSFSSDILSRLSNNNEPPGFGEREGGNGRLLDGGYLTSLLASRSTHLPGQNSTELHLSGQNSTELDLTKQEEPKVIFAIILNFKKKFNNFWVKTF